MTGQTSTVTALLLKSTLAVNADVYITYKALMLKFHWDQLPRNFPVANVTGKSPTSYEEVGRVASLLRGSYKEAGDFQTISTRQDDLATSPTSS